MASEKSNKSSSPDQPSLWEIVSMLHWMLPRPHSYASAYARALRKRRLSDELAEFDFFHRLLHGVPASYDQLLCAAMLLIRACNGNVPTKLPPPDKEFMVNPRSFDLLLERVEEGLGLLSPDHDK